MRSPEQMEMHAIFLKGMAAATEDHQTKEILRLSAEELADAAKRMCGQGFYGCNGGRKCGSDHK